MTIYKISNKKEEYRIRALSKDINELSGRSGNPELTRFISERIINDISAIGGI